MKSLKNTETNEKRWKIQKKKINRKTQKSLEIYIFSVSLTADKKRNLFLRKIKCFLIQQPKKYLYRQKKYCTKMKIPRHRLNLDKIKPKKDLTIDTFGNNENEIT